MRIIKFRAWDKKDKIMYYDIQKGIEFTDLSHYHFDEFLGNPNEMGDYHEWEVMQFTGLKDKNGKEIYCSDYLKCDDGKIREVVWYNLGAGWRIGTDDNDSLFNGLGVYAETNLEIIGNIYENPELLTTNN